MKLISALFLIIWSAGFLSAQTVSEDTLVVQEKKVLKQDKLESQSPEKIVQEIEKDNADFKMKQYNPTKAGLYSAVLPGLGQYYNNKKWKIPIVWGAIGAGVGFSIYFQKEYKRYRNAYISELNGQPHEFSDRPWVTKEVLGNVQDTRKRERDYAIVITSAVYLLQIIDAVVDAHLYEGRNDPDLAIQPTIIAHPYKTYASNPGLSLSYKF